MEKRRNMAEILGDDGEIDFSKLPDTGSQERTLIFKAAPRSRRGELIARGAKEIRCLYCRHIKPLAGAEESDEGWICEDCAPKTIRN
jgi:hypothetical protein